MELENLVKALDQASLMAKHLPTTTDQSHLHQIHTSLLSAHHQLSLFLSLNPSPENFSGAGAGEEPMQMEDDENESAKNLKTNVDKVEERMRECFIRNKRSKRRLSPNAVAEGERMRGRENEAERDGGGVVVEFDPVDDKLRALDLIYQFHA